MTSASLRMVRDSVGEGVGVRPRWGSGWRPDSLLSGCGGGSGGRIFVEAPDAVEVDAGGNDGDDEAPGVEGDEPVVDGLGSSHGLARLDIGIEDCSERVGPEERAEEDGAEEIDAEVDYGAAARPAGMDQVGDGDGAAAEGNEQEAPEEPRKAAGEEQRNVEHGEVDGRGGVLDPPADEEDGDGELDGRAAAGDVVRIADGGEAVGFPAGEEVGALVDLLQDGEGEGGGGDGGEGEANHRVPECAEVLELLAGGVYGPEGVGEQEIGEADDDRGDEADQGQNAQDEQVNRHQQRADKGALGQVAVGDEDGRAAAAEEFLDLGDGDGAVEGGFAVVDLRLDVGGELGGDVLALGAGEPEADGLEVAGDEVLRVRDCHGSPPEGWRRGMCRWSATR